MRNVNPFIKTVFLQFLRGLAIFIALTAISVVVLFAGGWASVHADLYQSPGILLSGADELSSRLNPLWFLLMLAEVMALTAMPVMLAVLWKKLHLWPLSWLLSLAIAPWILWAYGMLFPLGEFNYWNDSALLAYFVPVQLSLLAGIVIGHLLETARRYLRDGLSTSRNIL